MSRSIKKKKIEGAVKGLGTLYNIESCYDGRTLIRRSAYGLITSIDTKTCKEISRANVKLIRGVIPRPNSDEILILTRDDIVTWMIDCHLVSTQKLSLWKSVEHDAHIFQPNLEFGAFNSNGSLFLGISHSDDSPYNQKISLYDITKNELVLEVHTDSDFYDCAYSKHMKAFILHGTDGISAYQETSLHGIFSYDITENIYGPLRWRRQELVLDCTGRYAAVRAGSVTAKVSPSCIIVHELGHPENYIAVNEDDIDEVIFFGFDAKTPNLIAVSITGDVIVVNIMERTKTGFSLGCIPSLVCLGKKESVLYYISKESGPEIQRVSLSECIKLDTIKLLLLAHKFSAESPLHNSFIPRDIFLVIYMLAFPLYPMIKA